MRTAVALMAVILASCDAAGSWWADRSVRPNLGVSNGTTLRVTLVVNGRRVGDFPADGPRPTIDVAALPPLPWKVEARSASGRVLTVMTVEPGQVETTVDRDGVIGHSGRIGRVDLSCGRLTIWAGNIQPSGPAPPASPGTPGDCTP